MLDFLIVILFCWLFFKALGLALRMAWGTAKILASILFAIAVPMLALGLFFAGGILLLIPVALIALAFGILRSCI